MGVIASDFLPHQGFHSSLLTVLNPLKNRHGFVAGRRHYTKVVMALQPPVIDCRMPQLVKGEVLYPRPLAGRFLKPSLWFRSAARHPVNTFNTGSPLGLAGGLLEGVASVDDETGLGRRCGQSHKRSGSR
jgi:hypothetical protein